MLVVRTKQVTPHLLLSPRERAREENLLPPILFATPAKAGAHRCANTDFGGWGKALPLLENTNAAEEWVPAFAGMARRYAGVKR